MIKFKAIIVDLYTKVGIKSEKDFINYLKIKT